MSTRFEMGSMVNQRILHFIKKHKEEEKGSTVIYYYTCSH